MTKWPMEMESNFLFQQGCYRLLAMYHFCALHGELHLLFITNSPLHQGSTRLLLVWKERDWQILERMSLYGIQWRNPFDSIDFLWRKGIKSVTISYQLSGRQDGTESYNRIVSRNWVNWISTWTPVLIITYCENLDMSLYFVALLSLKKNK